MSTPKEVAIQREKDVLQVVKRGNKDIQKILNLVLKRWTRSKFTDTIYDFTSDSPLLEHAIKKQHRRVLRKFDRTYRDGLNEYLDTTNAEDLDLPALKLNRQQDKEIDEQVKLSFGHKSTTRTDRFARNILSNFQRAVEEKQRKVMIQMRGSGKTDESLTEEQDSALLVRRLIGKTNKRRSKLISEQETRSMSEFLANDEGLTTEMYYRQNMIAVLQSKKQWQTMDDNRVRGTNPSSHYNHVEAEGQLVNIGEPFVVSGEYLMYPKDSKGSLGNIINCRCISVPSWDYNNFIIYDPVTF